MKCTQQHYGVDPQYQSSQKSFDCSEDETWENRQTKPDQLNIPCTFIKRWKTAVWISTALKILSQWMVTRYEQHTLLKTNINCKRGYAFDVWILLYRLWKINHYMNYWIRYGTLKGYMPGASYMECFWSEKDSSTSLMALQVKLSSILYYINFSFDTCWYCILLLTVSCRAYMFSFL